MTIVWHHHPTLNSPWPCSPYTWNHLRGVWDIAPADREEADLSKLTAQWFGIGRKAQHPSNPAYPEGIRLDMGGSGKACSIEFDYPAPEVGSWLVKCELCGLSVLITAAGRPDDPRSIRVPCKIAGEA